MVFWPSEILGSLQKVVGCWRFRERERGKIRSMGHQTER